MGCVTLESLLSLRDAIPVSTRDRTPEEVLTSFDVVSHVSKGQFSECQQPAIIRQEREANLGQLDLMKPSIDPRGET